MKRGANYDNVRTLIKEFITNFEDSDMIESDDSSYAIYGKKKYLFTMQRVANQEIKHIEVFIEDLEEFFGNASEKTMVNEFRTNTSRYVDLFTEVIQEILPSRNVQIRPEEEIRRRFENILINQRLDNIQNNDEVIRAEHERLPLEALKKFTVSIVYGPKSTYETSSIRQLKADRIGSLVSVKAIVVRASDVKPQLVLATYTCEVCGFENYQEVNSKEFAPLVNCTSRKCKETKSNGKLMFHSSASKFISYQELKIQQTSDQLIEGSIPRTFHVQLLGELVKKASPGDVVEIQGILLPNKRDQSRYKTQIIFDAYLEAHKIVREKKKYVEFAITAQQLSEIQQIHGSYEDSDLFARLANSIAPEIFGLETVKKALLLLMVGGVTKQTHDNVRIRGEINVALIGDPGIAKSQLLKQITYLSPRGIYTTGKGSSGVGLTAAIIKDPITNQMSLEAGALVLADKGVCCIDQFDKMDEFDRTAIHEVMQQQTVSIAKAGIVTTLNARTSILAAANPLYGRYNKKETPHKNINLPAALLSRFDLIFILLDKADKEKDLEMAKHIGLVHQKKQGPKTNNFSSEILRSYIALAKQYQPVINENLHRDLTTRYIQKRKQQTDTSKQGYVYTTPRTLLGLIRLCQARARLRFSNEVSKQDVEQCLQLIEQSQSSILTDTTTRRARQDNISSIFEIIKNTLNYSDSQTQDRDVLLKKIMARGYAEDDFNKTLQSYMAANVLMASNQNNLVRLVETD